MTVRVMTLCHGNICRSPMAAAVLAARAADVPELAGLEVTSAGVSSEEIGNPIDPRAARTLSAADYPVPDHRAHQVGPDEIAEVDLIIAMVPRHLRQLEQIAGAPVPHAQLLTDFDPDAEPDSGVPDPWYGDESDFADTLAAIEAATPGILDRLRELAAR